MGNSLRNVSFYYKMFLSPSVATLPKKTEGNYMERIKWQSQMFVRDALVESYIDFDEL